MKMGKAEHEWLPYHGACYAEYRPTTAEYRPIKAEDRPFECEDPPI